MGRLTDELILTAHAQKRYAERVSKKRPIDVGLAEMFANGRKLRRLPVNRYNLRFFTKYPDCTFYKYFGHVLVTKEDVEGTVAVTVLDWNNDLKRCFY